MEIIIACFIVAFILFSYHFVFYLRYKQGKDLLGIFLFLFVMNLDLFLLTQMDWLCK